MRCIAGIVCGIACVILAPACNQDANQSPSPETVGGVVHTAETSLAPPESKSFPSADSVKHVGSWRLDRSAYVGLAASLAERASAYIERALGSVKEDSSPQRKRYNRVDVQNGPAYPLDTGWEEVGLESVPLLLLPPPTQARSITDPAFEPFADGRIQGRTVYFQPGDASRGPIYAPALPLGSRLSAGVFKYNPPHLRLGKIVLKSGDSDDPGQEPLGPLRLNRAGGATLLGWLRAAEVLPGNNILRHVRLTPPDQPAQQWIGYAIADANGARRGGSAFVLPNGESSFAIPLQSPHDPQFHGHSLLRVPAPTRNGAHEEITLNEWFANSEPPIYALTLDPSSSPFRESYAIRQIKPGSRIEEPIWLLIVFSHAQPEDLIAALRAIAPAEAIDPQQEKGLLEELHNLRTQALLDE